MAWDAPRRLTNLLFAQFDTSFPDGSVEGRLQWNIEDGTLDYGLPGGNVTLQIGQEILIKVTNKSNSDILDGKPVYISGAQGSRPTIELARADTPTTAVAVGMTTERINDNKNGYVNVFGLVRGVNTAGLPAGSIGFLSETTAGTMRTTPPAAPNFTTVMGYCLFESAEEGIFFVRALSAPRMISLSDVHHSTPGQGDFLAWNAANARFELKGNAGMLTPIGGFAVQLTNKTGAVSVAGQLVEIGSAQDDSVVLSATDNVDTVGVFLNDGIADGAQAWIVTGGIADVRFEDNHGPTRGDWVRGSSSEAGNAFSAGSPAAAPTHFEEIGHCLETVSAGGEGTWVKARCMIHFL